jgi:eukaryotic-like serine/threonine-protein kinase
MDRTALEVVLGRYALGEVLGHGGSATVYRAWDRRTDRAVALKRFAHGADGPDRHRQRAEVRTLARLDHPGLVRLLDAGTEDGRAHLVMDLVHGPSLAQRLADGCLPVPDVVALGSSLADALAYIHAEEITHRDVKPANVLLDPAYGPRLADFGIARLVDSTRVTATDAVVGTAAYMAPEQLHCAAVGPAADVYALGLVLLEAATGGLGLPGTGLEMVLTRLNTAPSIPAEWPASLRTLLQTMTDASPQRRPSAWQVAAALRAIADDPETDVPLGVAATSTTTTAGLGHPRILRASRSGPTWRRRRRAAAAAVGVLVVVATAVGVVLGVGGDPTPSADSVIATPAVPAPPSASGPGPVGIGAPPVGGVEPAPAPAAAASVGPGPATAPTAPERAPTAPPATVPSRTAAATPAGRHDDPPGDRGRANAGEGSGHGGKGADGP